MTTSRRAFLQLLLASAVGVVAQSYSRAQGLLVVHRRKHAPSNPSAIVAGAGTGAANNTYLPAGTFQSKAQFSTTGEDPQPGGIPAIYWDGTTWYIIGNVGADSWYISTDDVAFPWLVTTWTLGDVGANPVPVVTMG